jgi:type II secretory pathway predicted ATPase ExeA
LTGGVDDKDEFVTRLHGLLDTLVPVDGKIVLIIDEAQSLSEDLLRAARFFQTSHLIPGGRLAILLVAQQELNEVLSHPRHEGLTPADHHWLFARCPGAA